MSSRRSPTSSDLPRLLLAHPDGTVLEHPRLRAIGRSGGDCLEPIEPPIPLPERAKLVHLPGRLPMGLDPETGCVETVEELDGFVPHAVAAVLPPGYTRTFLPPARAISDAPLPQWAYAAAGWGDEGPVVWAVRTDRRTHWDPDRFSTPDLAERVERMRAEAPGNRVYAQLAHCALHDCCFTAQNIFYCRDEGGLPASTGCNARCVGCISQTRPGGPESSMTRITAPPSAEELAEVGAHHLIHATGRVMVSFGQGCEGEPLTRGPTLVETVRRMRRETARGSINVNTNASRPRDLATLLEAGVDAVRVSLNSAHPELYRAYYHPNGYRFEEVEESIAIARRAKAYLALNLLIFPGVTDRLGEVERLAELIVRHRIDQVQTRSLCIDPETYWTLARHQGAGGEPIGVANLIQALRAEAPWLTIGNFARGLSERGNSEPR